MWDLRNWISGGGGGGGGGGIVLLVLGLVLSVLSYIVTAIQKKKGMCTRFSDRAYEFNMRKTSFSGFVLSEVIRA